MDLSTFKKEFRVAWLWKGISDSLGHAERVEFEAIEYEHQHAAALLRGFNTFGLVVLFGMLVLLHCLPLSRVWPLMLLPLLVGVIFCVAHYQAPKSWPYMGILAAVLHVVIDTNVAAFLHLMAASWPAHEAWSPVHSEFLMLLFLMHVTFTNSFTSLAGFTRAGLIAGLLQPVIGSSLLLSPWISYHTIFWLGFMLLAGTPMVTIFPIVTSLGRLKTRRLQYQIAVLQTKEVCIRERLDCFMNMAVPQHSW